MTKIEKISEQTRNIKKNISAFEKLKTMRKILLTTLICIASTGLAYSQSLRATYYSDWYNNRLTSSGEVFKQDKLTCASNIYPKGTILIVTNIKNGKSVIVRVNDTGKLHNVAVDLSKRAFRTIGKLEQGVLRVRIQRIGFQKIKNPLKYQKLCF